MSEVCFFWLLLQRHCDAERSSVTQALKKFIFFTSYRHSLNGRFLKPYRFIHNLSVSKNFRPACMLVDLPMNNGVNSASDVFITYFVGASAPHPIRGSRIALVIFPIRCDLRMLGIADSGDARSIAVDP